MPGIISAKQGFHYSQLIRARDFRKYNYGPKRNQELYGQKKPPSYNLKKVTAPVFIHFGYNDQTSTPSDAIKLSHTLPNVIGIRPVPSRYFTHMDFMWASDGDEMLYDFIIEELNHVNK